MIAPRSSGWETSHPDREADLVRGTEQVPELHLLRYRDVRVGGDEQVLVDKHVAARISVSPGCGGEHANRAHREDGEHSS